MAEAFLHALTSETPKRRYLVVPNRREAEVTMRSIMTRIAQLNDGHEQSFTRDELVEMLDAALESPRR